MLIAESLVVGAPLRSRSSSASDCSRLFASLCSRANSGGTVAPLFSKSLKMASKEEETGAAEESSDETSALGPELLGLAGGSVVEAPSAVGGGVCEPSSRRAVGAVGSVERHSSGVEGSKVEASRVCGGGEWARPCCPAGAVRGACWWYAAGLLRWCRGMALGGGCGAAGGRRGSNINYRY